MVFLNPIFNSDNNRPYRWSLQYVDSGEIMDAVWLADNKYVHWTTKPTAVQRSVFTDISPYSIGNFTPMRKRRFSFLTTHHTNMYEDGKYTEVYNDPVNYIFDEDSTYTGAYLTAEARIGNYRSGIRRHITHLGGTLSENELDMLDDGANPPIALSSFPLFPPLPTTDFTLPFRTKLITSDVGYIDYIKTAHPDEATATDKYAYRSEQGTGFRRFIYSAGVAPLMETESTVINSVSKVDIADIETIVDTALSTAIAGSTIVTTKQFLPEDGEDVLINFPGFHAIKSQPTGYAIEMYDDVNLTTLVSKITTLVNGNIEVAAGLDTTPTTITITKAGNIIIDAAANIVDITAASVDITGDLNITGDVDIGSANVVITAAGALSMAGKLDVEGAADILGATSHGV